MSTHTDHLDGLPDTVPGVVHRAARLWPDDEAVVDPASTSGTARLTFAELDVAVRAAARAFVATGLQPGDRVPVWAPNMHQWIVAALGLYAAGGVLVPLNTRFKGTEAAHVLRTSGARFLFTVTDFLDTDYVELLDDAGARDLVEEIVILEGAVPGGTTDRVVSWTDFLARGANGADADSLDQQVEAREAALTGDSMCDIIFTSGTTGAPKGAMLRHGASVHLYASWADVVGLRHGDRYLLVYPLLPHRGAEVGPAGVAAEGCDDGPAPRVRLRRRSWRRSQAERISMLPGTAGDLPDHPQPPRRQRVRPVVAAAGGHRRRRRPRRARGRACARSSGSTPSSPATASPRPPAPSPCAATTTTPRSSPTPRAGRLDGIEVRIVDADGNEVPTGEPGEIVVRGYT